MIWFRFNRQFATVFRDVARLRRQTAGNNPERFLAREQAGIAVLL
jgi:hypothetical protein